MDNPAYHHSRCQRQISPSGEKKGSRYPRGRRICSRHHRHRRPSTGAVLPRPHLRNLRRDLADLRASALWRNQDLKLSIRTRRRRLLPGRRGHAGMRRCPPLPPRPLIVESVQKPRPTAVAVMTAPLSNPPTRVKARGGAMEEELLQTQQRRRRRRRRRRRGRSQPCWPFLELRRSREVGGPTLVAKTGRRPSGHHLSEHRARVKTLVKTLIKTLVKTLGWMLCCRTFGALRRGLRRQGRP